MTFIQSIRLRVLINVLALTTVSILCPVQVAQAKSVYAVLYTEEGDFFIARKCNRGYYFTPNREFPNRPYVYKDGVDFRPKKGGGKLAFPGGKLENNEEPLTGAIRELKEETGERPIAIKESGPKPSGSGQSPPYHAVYIRLDKQWLRWFLGQVKWSFEAKQRLRELVSNDSQQIYADTTGKGYAWQYGLLMGQTNDVVPADDELCEAEIMNIEIRAHWQRILNMKDQYDVGWYYEIAEALESVIAKRRPQ